MFTLAEASALLREGKLSSVEITQACLANIDRLNLALNAFIAVTADLAMKQARAADADTAAGTWRGPLHGIPVALKDLIDVAGVPTTAASRQLQGHIANRDAEVVARLRQQGAVILGKTNLHEFAFGGSGVISAYGPARNPWDTSRITGGSSSGSAAAVASGMCFAALGTDTAGSVRIPAALCGIVGHRPSRNVCRLDGVIPLRKSFDTVGPITRTVEDARILLRTLSDELPLPAAERDIRQLRVGVARDGFCDGLDPEVAAGFQQAEQVLRRLVSELRDVAIEVDIRWTDFDEEILEYHQPFLERSPELYEPGTLVRVQDCAAISTAAYEAAKSALAAQRREAEKVFDHVDIVITPTCVVPAPLLSELKTMSARDLRVYEVNKLLRNTAPFSLLFWPSVSVPCGFTSSGLPIGLQISAPPGADELALAVAQAYELATAWHKRTPPIFA